MTHVLAGKHALVTGSSRGIGRAIAQRLAKDGAAVIIHYVRNAKAAGEAVGAILEEGGKAVAIQADLAQPSEVQRLFEEAEQAIGALDIVFANAADALVKPLIKCTEEDFDRIFTLNAKGVFFTLQQAARRVRSGGRIIAISSGGTKMFFAQTSLYLGSKGAVEQFVRVLSRELGDRNITVNALLPGFTDTDLLPERDRAVGASMSPFNRIGNVEDVADAAVFLASDDARWVTGQNLGAGGGVF